MTTESHIFDQISLRIIREQELVIGPVAWEQARKVSGLSIIDQRAGTISVSGNGPVIIDSLVSQYVHLFGNASKEVCKDAVQDLLADMNPNDVPNSLK